MAEIIVKAESVEKHGPYGNKDGRQWCMMLDTSKFETISEVIIKSGSIIDSIAFTAVEPTPCGCTYSATHTRFGGNGGSQQHKITLKCGEYITNISGATGEWNGECFVAKLMLHTNLCPEGYGPYGHGMGVANFAKFSTPTPSGGCVAGFFGTHNKYLNSVGVYGKKIISIEKDGPYGSQLQETWDVKLGQDSMIKEVIINHGHIVDAIEFVIVKSCGFISTDMFGSQAKQSKITLKYGEYITHISGIYGDYGEQHGIIGMLKVHTNLHPKGYGPYGLAKNVEKAGIFLSPPMPSSSRIVGFFGSHGKHLQSIGTYLENKDKLAPSMCPNKREVVQISETSSSNNEDESKSPSVLTKGLIKLEKKINDCDLSDVEAEIIRSSA